MSTELRVGDRVRALEDCVSGWFPEVVYYRAGEEGVVVEIDSSLEALVAWENQKEPIDDSRWWLEEDLDYEVISRAA